MRHRTTLRYPIVAAAAAAVVALAGCGGAGDTAEPVAEAAAGPARTEYGLVTADQASELAARGVTVIDVRTPEEFAEGHIEGAQLIDFYSDTFAEEIAALDADGEYLVYCRSGNRSGQTVALMAKNGIDQVWDLQGGVLAAESSGLLVP